MRVWAMIMLCLAVPAQAQDWTVLDHDGILAALTARSVVYQGGETQDFRAGGATAYEAKGAVSNGHWDVRGDQYCSVWPPSDLWVCYDMRIDASGLDLGFVAADGSVTVGRYNDL